MKFQLLARDDFHGGRNISTNSPRHACKWVQQLAFLDDHRIGRERGDATVQREKRQHLAAGFGSNWAISSPARRPMSSAAWDTRPSQVNVVHQASARRTVEQVKPPGNCRCQLPPPPPRPPKPPSPWVCAARSCERRWPAPFRRWPDRCCCRRWRGRCRRLGQCGQAATARGPQRFDRDKPSGRRRF